MKVSTYSYRPTGPSSGYNQRLRAKDSGEALFFNEETVRREGGLSSSAEINTTVQETKPKPVEV